MELLGPELICTPLTPQLPGQVRAGGSGEGRAREGSAPTHRSQAGEEGAGGRPGGGRARRGQRGGEGRGRRLVT